MFDLISKILAFLALWVTITLLVTTIVLPVYQQFDASKSKANKVKGQASSAPWRHNFRKAILLSLVVALLISLGLFYLAKGQCFGRSFWVENWLAKQMPF